MLFRTFKRLSKINSETFGMVERHPIKPTDVNIWVLFYIHHSVRTIILMLPIKRYNCIANLNLNRTQLGRICSLDRRVSQILGKPMTPIFNLIKKHAVLRVKKSLSVGMCSSFRNYFQKLEHKVSTRNNGKLLKIPKVKLEFACSGFFFFMDARIFNSLPM